VYTSSFVRCMTSVAGACIIMKIGSSWWMA